MNDEDVLAGTWPDDAAEWPKVSGHGVQRIGVELARENLDAISFMSETPLREMLISTGGRNHGSTSLNKSFSGSFPGPCP